MGDERPLVRQCLVLNTLAARPGGATVRKLAEEHGVGRKSIRRDLEVFRSGGFPLEETVLTCRSLRATEPVTCDAYPCGLVYHRGSLYLVGHAPRHGRSATGRSSIGDVPLAQLIFPGPEAFDLRAHLTGSFGVFPAPPTSLPASASAPVAPYIQQSRFPHGPAHPPSPPAPSWRSSTSPTPKRSSAGCSASGGTPWSRSRRRGAGRSWRSSTPCCTPSAPAHQAIARAACEVRRAAVVGTVSSLAQTPTRQTPSISESACGGRKQGGAGPRAPRRKPCCWRGFGERPIEPPH